MRYMRRCLPFSRLAVVSFSGGIALTMVPAYKKAVFHAPKYGFPHCVVHFIRALGNFRGARIDFAKRGKQRQFLFFAPSYSRTFCGASCSLACTTPLQVSPTISCCLYWLHCTPSAHGIFQKQPLLYSSLTSCGARSLQS